MLAELSAEQWDGWLRAHYQGAFGERRADERSAAAVLWQLAPYSKDADLPNLHWPYFQSDEEKLADLIGRTKALDDIKAKIEVGTWPSQSPSSSSS